MKVHTLLGDVEPRALGKTLIHEHLAVDWGEMLGRPKILDFEYDTLRDKMVNALKRRARVGHRRNGGMYAHRLRALRGFVSGVAARSPVKIICSTGFFHESWCPMHPIARAFDIDMMTDLFVREITEGMGDTLIRRASSNARPAKGRSRPKRNRSCARRRARKQTGCPIITHTTGGLGNEQLDIFESEGRHAQRNHYFARRL